MTGMTDLFEYMEKVNKQEETKSGNLCFEADIARGNKGERLFVEKFLQYFNIECDNVSQNPIYQRKGYDFITSLGNIEVKTRSGKDVDTLCIEEYSNRNEDLGPIKRGWWYTTEADYIFFVFAERQVMVILKMNDEVRAHYDSIKENYYMYDNDVTQWGKATWQSSFRCVPVTEMREYIAWYKKP